MTKAPERIKVSNSITFGVTYEKTPELKEFFPLTEYTRTDHALALVAADRDASGLILMPPECAPKGIPLLVAGGIAMKKTGGQWFTGMEEPSFERPIQWEVKWWSPIPQQNDLRTPDDATAALERVKKEYFQRGVESERAKKDSQSNQGGVE